MRQKQIFGQTASSSQLLLSRSKSNSKYLLNKRESSQKSQGMSNYNVNKKYTIKCTMNSDEIWGRKAFTEW